jgi:hypothetical protein
MKEPGRAGEIKKFISGCRHLESNVKVKRL